MIICATGHRPDKLWGYDNNHPRYKDLHDLCLGLFEEIAPDRIISGMALGFDTVFAVAAIRYKRRHPECILEAAVPCRGQEKKWNADAQKLYVKLLGLMDKVTYVAERYSPACMQQRNEYMIDASDLVVALWNGDRFGGTFNAVEYATRKGKRIHHIDPRTFAQEG